MVLKIGWSGLGEEKSDPVAGTCGYYLSWEYRLDPKWNIKGAALGLILCIMMSSFL